MDKNTRIVLPQFKDADGQPLRLFRANAENNASKAVDQLVGICKGILADGIVVQSEAEFFRKWIVEHVKLEPVWPLVEILSRIEKIFADGQVDAKERDDLRLIMEEIAGTKGNGSNAEDRSSQLPLDDPQPPIVFPQTIFCITGRFAFGTRAKVCEAISCRGGIPQDSYPTIDTRYLVIGAFASRDWKYTNYGTKIERAIEYRDEKKSGISIVSEEHWKGYLL